MATAIERLYKLSVDGNQAVAQLNRISDSTKNVDKQIQSFTKGFSDFKNKVLIGFSAAAVVAGFKGIVDAMSEIVDSSQKLGVSTDELQKLRFAAQQTGVDAGALDIGIKKLSIGLTQIDDASSEAGKQLRALGVTSKDTVGTALEKVAGQFEKAADGSKKTAVAVQAFGKSGNQLIPLLNSGAEGLRAFNQEMEDLGLIVDGRTLGLFDQFGDQMDKLQRVLGSVGIQIASGLLPALTAIADAFVQAAKGGEGFRGVGASLGEGIINLSVFFIKLWTTVRQFAAGLGAAAAALVAFFSGNFREAATIMTEWAADTDKAGAQANKTIETLEATFKKYVEEGVKPTTRSHKELEDGTKGLDAAFKKWLNSVREIFKAEEAFNRLVEKANDDFEKRIEKLAEEVLAVDNLVELNDRLLIQMSGLNDIYEIFKDTLGSTAEGVREFEVTTAGVLRQSEEFEKKIRDEATAVQLYFELLQTGTDIQKEFARQQLAIIDSSRKNSEELKKTTGPLEIVQDNFKSFFKNLENGTERAAELFKRMVQSIIAQLLRLAAQKLLLNAFGIDIGTSAAKGIALQDGKIVRRFAKGTILTSPVMFPMSNGFGQAGEAGAEGVFPLTRTSSGDLGVKGTQPVIQVHVHNNNGSAVDVQTSEDGSRIDVIIERTRRALSNDVRTGGNLFSSAVESTYALGRARA